MRTELPNLVGPPSKHYLDRSMLNFDLFLLLSLQNVNYVEKYEMASLSYPGKFSFPFSEGVISELRVIKDYGSKWS